MNNRWLLRHYISFVPILPIAMKFRSANIIIDTSYALTCSLAKEVSKNGESLVLHKLPTPWDRFCCTAAILHLRIHCMGGNEGIYYKLQCCCMLHHCFYIPFLLNTYVHSYNTGRIALRSKYNIDGLAYYIISLLFLHRIPGVNRIHRSQQDHYFMKWLLNFYARNL